LTPASWAALRGICYASIHRAGTHVLTVVGRGHSQALRGRRYTSLAACGRPWRVWTILLGLAFGGRRGRATTVATQTRTHTHTHTHAHTHTHTRSSVRCTTLGFTGVAARAQCDRLRSLPQCARPQKVKARRPRVESLRHSEHRGRLDHPRARHSSSQQSSIAGVVVARFSYRISRHAGSRARVLSRGVARQASCAARGCSSGGPRGEKAYHAELSIMSTPDWLLLHDGEIAQRIILPALPHQLRSPAMGV
jgi:hypothetical protein